MLFFFHISFSYLHANRNLLVLHKEEPSALWQGRDTGSHDGVWNQVGSLKLNYYYI